MPSEPLQPAAATIIPNAFGALATSHGHHHSQCLRSPCNQPRPPSFPMPSEPLQPATATIIPNAFTHRRPMRTVVTRTLGSLLGATANATTAKHLPEKPLIHRRTHSNAVEYERRSRGRDRSDDLMMRFEPVPLSRRGDHDRRNSDRGQRSSSSTGYARPLRVTSHDGRQQGHCRSSSHIRQAERSHVDPNAFDWYQRSRNSSLSRTRQHAEGVRQLPRRTRASHDKYHSRVYVEKTNFANVQHHHHYQQHDDLSDEQLSDTEASPTSNPLSAALLAILRGGGKGHREDREKITAIGQASQVEVSSSRAAVGVVGDKSPVRVNNQHHHRSQSFGDTGRGRNGTTNSTTSRQNRSATTDSSSHHNRSGNTNGNRSMSIGAAASGIAVSNTAAAPSFLRSTASSRQHIAATLEEEKKKLRQHHGQQQKPHPKLRGGGVGGSGPTKTAAVDRSASAHRVRSAENADHHYIYHQSHDSSSSHHHPHTARSSGVVAVLELKSQQLEEQLRQMKALLRGVQQEGGGMSESRQSFSDSDEQSSMEHVMDGPSLSDDNNQSPSDSDDRSSLSSSRRQSSLVNKGPSSHHHKHASHHTGIGAENEPRSTARLKSASPSRHVSRQTVSSANKSNPCLNADKAKKMAGLKIVKPKGASTTTTVTAQSARTTRAVDALSQVDTASASSSSSPVAVAKQSALYSELLRQYEAFSASSAAKGSSPKVFRASSVPSRTANRNEDDGPHHRSRRKSTSSSQEEDTKKEEHDELRASTIAPDTGNNSSLDEDEEHGDDGTNLQRAQQQRVPTRNLSGQQARHPLNRHSDETDSSSSSSSSVSPVRQQSGANCPAVAFSSSADATKPPVIRSHSSSSSSSSMPTQSRHHPMPMASTHIPTATRRNTSGGVHATTDTATTTSRTRSLVRANWEESPSFLLQQAERKEAARWEAEADAYRQRMLKSRRDSRNGIAGVTSRSRAEINKMFDVNNYDDAEEVDEHDHEELRHDDRKESRRPSYSYWNASRTLIQQLEKALGQ